MTTTEKVMPVYEDAGVRLFCGDALSVLRSMPDESVQCVVTSPPYFGLRDYSSPPTIWGGNEDCEHEWVEQITPAANGLVNNDMQGETLSETSATRKPRRSDFCSKCNAWKGSLGLEPSPQLFVRNLVLIFREIRRVLKKDGSLWLNLGDSYAGSGRGRDADGTWNPGKGGTKQETNKGAIIGRVVNEKSFHKSLIENGHTGNAWVKPPAGYKQKDLMGIPWRVAFALQDDGWWLRQDIIWSKPNPMPESVTDRCTKAHEYIFLLTKSRKYYFNQDAIREPLKDASIARLNPDLDAQEGSDRVPGKTNGNMKAVVFGGTNRCPDTRLQSGKEGKPRYKNLEANGQKNHSFHESREEGKEWKPKGRDRSNGNRNGEGASTLDTAESLSANKKSVWTVTTQPFKDAHFATFPPKLIEPMILAGSREGDTVLDPFNGAGTTGLVSLRHRRNYVGIEINPEYIEMTKRRLAELQVKLF
jgi:DNA modification methylase